MHAELICAGAMNILSIQVHCEYGATPGTSCTTGNTPSGPCSQGNAPIPPSCHVGNMPENHS